MTRKLLTLAAAAGAAMLGATPEARAWDGPGQWYQPAHAANPGGGGILGTGGQGDHNIQCTHCHVKSMGKIDVSFTPVPAWGTLGAAKTYKPGTRYQITVNLLGEYLGKTGCGMYSAHINNFVATFEDVNGKPTGKLETDNGVSQASCPKDYVKATSGTTSMYGDCRAIFPAEVPDGATQWKFFWTAPAAGTGTISLFAGAVDGDCMMNSLDDDVKLFTLKLSEGMASPSRPPPEDGGRRGSPVLIAVGFGLVGLPGGVRLARRRSLR